MNDSAVVVQDGIVQYTSSGVSELLGYAEGYPIDRPMDEFIAPDSPETVQRRHHAWMRGDESDFSDRHELELLSKDGRRIPVEVNVSRIQYDGHPATLSLIRDITERKRRQERFRRV